MRGTLAEIAARLAAREGHFFEPQLLDSQFAVLEEPAADEHVITVSISERPAEVVAAIHAQISSE